MDNNIIEIRNLIANKSYKEAIKIIDNLLLNNSTLELYALKIQSLYELGDYEKCIPILNKIILMQPNNSEYYRYRAECILFSTQNYNESIRDLNISIKINPEDDNLYYKRALCYFLKYENQFQEIEYLNKALEDINKAIIECSSKHRYYYLKSDINNILGDTSCAIYDIDMAILLEPNEKMYYLKRAFLKKENHQFEEAIEDINYVLSIDPFELDALYYLANIYSELEEYNEALEDIEKILDIDPENTIASLEKARIKIKTENYDEAITILYRNLNETKFLPEIYLELGKCFMEKYRNEEALEFINNSISLDSNIHLSYLYKAKILEELGDYENAIENYLRINSILDTDILYSQKIADLYFKLNRYEEALKFYNKLILFTNKYIDAFINRAICRMELKQFDKANSDLKVALAIDPNNIQALELMGSLQKNHYENYQESIKFYKRLYKLGIKNKEIYKSLVESYLNLDDLESSLLYSTEFLNKEPKSSLSNYYYGKVLIFLNRKEEAKEYLIKAKLDGYKNAEVLLQYI